MSVQPEMISTYQTTTDNGLNEIHQLTAYQSAFLQVTGHSAYAFQANNTTIF